jgi:thiosulfate reductase cytochrome b subunit
VSDLGGPRPATPRHALFVRITHWITAIAFLALLVSGFEVVLSHPRFYWGEVGNVNTTPLFVLPVPSSRSTVPTSYNFTLPDQNGWSRYLHFQSAWLALFTALIYLVLGFRTGHFRNHLVPDAADRSWRAIRQTIGDHLRFNRRALGDPSAYNALQRISYLAVIFVLFPVIIWTGLAMAPAFTAIFPSSVTILGGRQSARTLHFIVTILLVLFILAHVTMIILAGFRARMRPMITGVVEAPR